MRTKTILISLAFLFILTSFVAAEEITATIGNSRMILNLDPGESVQKYILVKNTNAVPVTIELTSSGDLTDTLEIKEATFVLQPGEDKKAYFTITAGNKKSSETKIFVKFVPPTGSGVGLSSTILIFNPDATGEEDTAVDSSQNSTGGLSGSDLIDGVTSNAKKLSPAAILIISTLILVLIFLILVIYYNKKVGAKKGAGRPRA